MEKETQHQVAKPQGGKQAKQGLKPNVEGTPAVSPPAQDSGKHSKVRQPHAASKPSTKPEKKQRPVGAVLAVIRVRGVQGVRWKASQTMIQLRLTRRNHLVLVTDSPVVHGMLKECKDYITWGEASEEILSKLKGKFGEQKVYRLSPARKGFSSLKMPFPKGALGYRGEKINDLAARML